MNKNLQEMIQPVWKGEKLYRETFAMVLEEGICRARFLFHPSKVLRVESYDGAKTYLEGKDYVVEEDYLIRTADSEIPFADWKKFYFDTREEAVREMEERKEPLGFGPVQTEEGSYVSLAAVGAPSYVTECQVTVTYLTEEQWTYEIPERQLEQLPGLEERFRKKLPVRLVLFGDSISCGYDCSGMYGQKPGQPVWPLLLKDSLEAFYQMEVELINTSVGGMASDWALEHVQENVCDYRPDLVLLGFGMNDRCPGKEYAQKTERLIDAVRAGCPEAEIVLMATSLPNPLVKTAPFYFWAYQDEYADALRKLCGPGIALADIQGVQKSLMQRKRYIDLTGNLLNHPNDYLARIQAQVLDSVLRG